MQSTSILSKEEWALAVGKCMGSTFKFQVLDVTVGPLPYQLSGYMGDHLRVQVTISVESTPSQSHILKFFIKRIPVEDNVKAEYILSTGSFHKETTFYCMVVQHFRRYLVKGQLPWAPECYFSRPDVIVMEDLLDKGFALFDKTDFMDYNHCHILLQTIARFHASSIVLEEREGELSNKKCKLNEIYPNLLVENMFVTSGSNCMSYWFRTSSNAMKALLPHLPNYGINTEFHDEVMDKVSGTIDRMVDLLKPSSKYRNVICHGDVWTNNFLFRYGDDQKTPVEVRLVDFQMCRYTPPAVDVMACLIMTTSRAFRKQHEEELLQVYYRSLSRELLRNGYVAEQLLPWGEFQASCCDYGITARIHAAFSFPRAKLPKATFEEMIDSLTDEDVLMKQDTNKVVLHAFNTNPEYRMVLSDTLDEMIECDILTQ